MATDKQREANRNNAQKSTGPRTDAGKEASRANALKHGLTAESLVVLADEDPAQLDERVGAFFRAIGPRDEFEDYEVRRLALLSWKADRADRHDVASINRRVRERTEADQVKDRGRIDELIDRLVPRHESFKKWGFDPISAASLVEEIESTAEGCLTLLGCWGQLRRALDRELGWDDGTEMSLLRLLGHGPAMIAEPKSLDLIVASRVYKSRLTELDTDFWEGGRFPMALDREPLKAACLRRPKTYIEAHKILREAVDAAVARLEEILALRRREGGGPDASESARLAMFDAGIEGERLRRYQVATGREMDRIVRSIERRRDKELKRQMDEVKLALLRHKADQLGVSWAVPEPPILRNEPNSAVESVESPDFADCPAADEAASAVPEPPILRNEPNFAPAPLRNEPKFDLGEFDGVEWIDIPSLL